MKEKQRYTTDLFDIDAIAAISKLSLDESERQSFLHDICDMANYTYEALGSESVDDALAVCALAPKRIDELREDSPKSSGLKNALLRGAPDAFEDFVRVVRTVGNGEGQK